MREGSADNGYLVHHLIGAVFTAVATIRIPVLIHLLYGLIGSFDFLLNGFEIHMIHSAGARYTR